MSTYYWLQSQSVPLTLEAVAQMDDNEARMQLAEMRWGSRDEQVCPACGVVDRHYNIRTRCQWRCKHCTSTFSVTTDTPFADHKIGYRKLLLAMFAFIINHKGLAALALRRIIGGQYRTSYVLLHKLREAVMITATPDKLGGIIEIDGGHFSGRPRKGRAKKKPTKEDKNQVPAKYRQHREKFKSSEFPFHPNRRIVVVIREVLGADAPDGIKGAARTVVAVCRSENAADIEALVRKPIRQGSLIRSDELPAYGNLKLMGYDHEAVNHSKEFSTDGGVNQNQAESFFSRMRRATIGIYHRITPRYMLDYACEMAWREDVRRQDTMVQLKGLFSRICRAGLSVDWINYCRGNRRPSELLFQAPLALP